MKRRAALTFLATSATTIGAPGAFAQASNLADVLHKAGAQRMLSQRLSKAYLLLGLGVVAGRAQAIINESMARFERQLLELAAFAPKAPIKATYAELHDAWTQYKTLLVGHAPHRDRVPALLEMDDKVLRLANQGTLQLEQELGGSLGRVLNLCGRPGMLSQRAAKLFLAQLWKTPAAGLEAEMTKTMEEFVSTMAALDKEPQSTPPIRQELELARQQWVFFDVSLGFRHNVPRAAENVFAASENLLGVMERVTAMYARLATA